MLAGNSSHKLGPGFVGVLGHGRTAGQQRVAPLADDVALFPIGGAHQLVPSAHELLGGRIRAIAIAGGRIENSGRLGGVRFASFAFLLGHGTDSFRGNQGHDFQRGELDCSSDARPLPPSLHATLQRKSFLHQRMACATPTASKFCHRQVLYETVHRD